MELRRYLRINGSRFDLIDDNKPFVGNAAMPPGRGFYPHGLTREQIEQYVKEHPEKKDEIYNATTVVRWQGDQFEGVAVSRCFPSFLEPAAKTLREAADLSADPAFANFLRLRADALLNDDYFKSDLAWLDLKDPKFDVIFAPYETYLDDLLGVKDILRRRGPDSQRGREQEARRCSRNMWRTFRMRCRLPGRPSVEARTGNPMEVMDAPYRGGDLRHGYQAVADNLPNDPRVHEQKGSKKIFFKNFMDARVNYVILPLAQY